MSVLFQALTKAARDHEARTCCAAPVTALQTGMPVTAPQTDAPVNAQPMPVVVPLLEMSPPSKTVWFVVAGFAAFLAVAVGAAVAVYAAKRSVAPAPAVLMGASPVAPDLSVQGIALPADSLNPPALDDSATDEIVNQVKSLPALERGSAAQTSQKKIIVHDEEKPLRDEAGDDVQALLERGNYAGALRLYDQMLDNNPKDTRLLQGKISVLEQSGLASAAAALRRMAEDYPGYVPLQAALARQLTRQGDAAGAAAAWQKALALDPDNASSRLSLAVLLDHNGQRDAALEQYRKLPSPRSPEVQRRLDYLSGTSSDKAE